MHDRVWERKPWVVLPVPGPKPAARPRYSRDSAAGHGILIGESHYVEEADPMQDLRIVSVEDGSLMLVADDGSRFRLAIDETLHARVRQSVPDSGTGRKLSPKEIQAHIRAGLSSIEVARITGSSIEYIERFEGPVLAERAFVIDSALAVPVHTAGDDPLAAARTFGSAIIERLREVDGADERWASWKEPTGWVVGLSFTANEVEHDARWQFDPRKHTLSPVNAEAIRLSQQGAAPEPLIPRLRAVAPSTSDEPTPVTTRERFDSDAFRVDPASIAEATPSIAPMGMRSAPEDDDIAGNRTADLLEALRRRRGERESVMVDDLDVRGQHATGTVRLLDVPIGDDDDAGTARQTGPIPRGKKARPAMPSWDEIVFGTRPDEDN